MIAADAVTRCRDDDGLYLPDIKRHSLQKIALHNRYAELFSTATKNSWPQRAYIGLYAGAGRARVHGTDEIVETSALAVLRQKDPFTHYIYVDNANACVAALRARIDALRPAATVTIIEGDVNERVDAAVAALPPYSPRKGLLSFCFIDPFDLQLHFATIKKLGERRIDLLVLLMLGVDARRNFASYYQDPASDRIGRFIDCLNWRTEYDQGHRRNVIHFLMEKFDDAMVRVGFPSATEDLFHPVTAAGTSVLQYVLAFYSKSELGKKLWRATRESLAAQLGLGLE